VRYHAERLRADHQPAPLPKPGAPGPAIERLARAGGTEYHGLWPCPVSLVDDHVVDASRLHGPRQVTGAYLLALAVARDGRFVASDRSIPLSAVRGAKDPHLTVL
jgi:predicted nucleic acid-binding protein